MYGLNEKREHVQCCTFSKENFDGNKGKRYQYSTFRYDYVPHILLPETDLSGYDGNFIQGTIPGSSVLYFDDTAKFPRTRLCVSGFKRCIKLSKANFIVVNDKMKHHKTDIQHVFKSTDGIYYVIDDLYYSALFNSSFDVMRDTLKTSDPTLFSGTHVYSGKLTEIEGLDYKTLYHYIDGDYTIPFITDKQLFDQVNSLLTEPTIDDILSLGDMLQSTDKSVVKLGIDMVAGFNLTKYRLTFRLLLASCCNNRGTNGTKAHCGGNGVTAKMLKDMLDISGYGYFSSILNNLQEKITYEDEDIQLAQELFALKYSDFEVNLKANPNDFGKNLKFIPDVWKK